MKIKFILFFFLISILAVYAQETKKEEIPDPNEFVKVEKEPAVIQQVKPIFPDEAFKKGLAGKVVLRVLVGKDGKPKRTITVKSSNKIFEQPAIDAVMKTLFAPAIQNGKPIMCWVSQPFNFNPKPGSAPTKSAPVHSKKK